MCYNISYWLFFTTHIIIHQHSSHPHWLRICYNALSRPVPHCSHGDIIIQCVCLYSGCTDTCMLGEFPQVFGGLYDNPIYNIQSQSFPCRSYRVYPRAPLQDWQRGLYSISNPSRPHGEQNHIRPPVGSRRVMMPS